MASKANPQADLKPDYRRTTLSVNWPSRELKVVATSALSATPTQSCVTGKDTAGRFCLVDMFVPPGGGPPPHRHDFEETFSLIEGELELTFRGNKIQQFVPERP